MRYARAVLIVFSALTCVYGAEIEILVIDSRTAKPKTDVPLDVKVTDRPGGLPRPIFNTLFAIKSNAAGTARVDIDAVACPFVIVGGYDLCSPVAAIEIQQVLGAGVIAPNHCWHKNRKLASLKPRPGQLIIFRDVPSFWWLLRHPP